MTLTMLKLKVMRTYKLEWFARCPGCGREYEFATALNRGCGDTVTVSCECGAYVGKVRSDVGGNIHLRALHEVGKELAGAIRS